jgi:hypothetical protein
MFNIMDGSLFQARLYSRKATKGLHTSRETAGRPVGGHAASINKERLTAEYCKPLILFVACQDRSEQEDVATLQETWFCQSIINLLHSLIRCVDIDKFQCNIGSLNPYDFTNKFTKESRIHTHFAIITNRQRVGKTHKRTTHGDILDQA